jgi:hypothetical protein
VTNSLAYQAQQNGIQKRVAKPGHIRNRQIPASHHESTTSPSTAALTTFSSFKPRNPSLNNRFSEHQNAAHHDSTPPLSPLSHRLSKRTSTRRTYCTIHIRPPSMCLELRSSVRCPRQMRTTQHRSRRPKLFLHRYPTYAVR